MDEILKKSMKKCLVNLAKNKEHMRYQEFCDTFQLGYDMQDVEDRKKIGKILGEISESEHSERKPLLSVFIQHEDGLPGPGFFTMAEELGRFIPTFMDKKQFVSREMSFAYDYWNKHKF
ncbi:hypothetical protein SAMN04487900_103176 [Prevotella communis]|uniref:Uncharacterized protein n=1 Tax=Prevotella communis TaxID=2913614 RepID=A0A1H0EHV8_9BACT|nr:hypothetical protein [Prevotella communis]SDN82067.1 hypothetical protein SAMN04487900_103176 [Prevotella communis]